MRVSELRLGNLVKINDRGCDCIYRVTGISEEDINAQCINRCDPFKEVYNEPIENVSPALLTEEWLVRFGFWSNPYQDQYELGSFYINCDKTKGVLNLWVDGCSLDLHHVHQLQNLYFALCGEELTLNK